ncbi:expressed unknown protein [Seminavis robusta]|uniref:Uncharacterized protein n=1 Tax=Seminavis robusta TaxID=568900 RepID=A0A9N8HLA8_9STRA|nr:expressed unknown protein [Seminavis robusta]|eukprot:Sro670_g184610.1 n/a (349) ;mRNA; f:142-1188
MHPAYDHGLVQSTAVGTIALLLVFSLSRNCARLSQFCQCFGKPSQVTRHSVSSSHFPQRTSTRDRQSLASRRNHIRQNFTCTGGHCDNTQSGSIPWGLLVTANHPTTSGRKRQKTNEEDEDEDDMDEVDDTFQPAIQAMKSISGHSRLQQITIYGPSLVAAAPELHTNATLRFLKVKLGMIKRRTRSNNTFEGQVLADVVRSAPSLATLVLTVGHEALRCRIDGQILHVIQALQENTTITKLDLPYHPKNHDIQEAMIDMLQENNMTLTEINVLLSSDNDNAAEDETFLQKQEFFLRLNRLGRKRLLQLSPADRRPWIETLATVSNDVSSLFYFLSKNPTLCSHVATE